MPALSQVELFLDGTYLREEQKNFIFRSRCICNYLERSLAENPFETTLSRVNIHCIKDASLVRVLPLKGAPYLEICIQYDLPPLSELSEVSLQNHYAQIIDFGLRAGEDFMPFPHGYCMSTLRRFAEAGFENKWIHAEKSWKQWSIRSELVAQLTMEKFLLWQSIYRDEELIAKKKIVETRPREMLFVDYLVVHHT